LELGTPEEEKYI